MNKAAKIIYSAVFFGICALPLALYPAKKNTLEVEKRALAEKPKLLTEDGKLNSDFSGEFDSWFSDHLPFRPQLLTAADAVRSEVFGSSAAGVVTGRNGFIFSDTTVPSFIGANALTERELNDIAITLSLIQEQTAARGAGFLFAPVPNKNTVYSEYMPFNYKRTEQTDLERLYPVLGEYGIGFADLLGTMRSAKESGQLVYHKRDTHWNYLGAFYGYNAIMEALGRDHKLYADQSGYTVERDWRGDLDKLLYPTGDGIPDWQYHFEITFDDFSFVRPPGITDTAAALENFMSDKEENDHLFSTRKTMPSTGRALYMVRDSFGRALLPYMIDNYDTATFTRTNIPNISQIPPNGDFIYEIVERNLATVISTAPNMPAPARELGENAGSGKLIDGGSLLFALDYPYGTRIFGTLNEKLISNGSRIYVRLTGDGGSFVFEAFPIIEAEELEAQGVTEYTKGCGVSMFLDKKSLPAGDYDIEIFTEVPGSGIWNRTGVLTSYTVVPSDETAAQTDTE